MSDTFGAGRGKRAAIELILLIVVGAAMTVMGPYGTSLMPLLPRTAYWLISIVGGGLIGILIDEALRRRVTGLWRRTAATSVAMTPPVALLVLAVGHLLAPANFRPGFSVTFLGQVWVVSALVMLLRALSWREPRRVVETRTVIAPPLPEAEAAFRRRLSARRRSARLIALQAEDHYLRVHTDAGEELLTLRFTDALAELAGAHGLRTHRSWWVAADAIEGARWRRGAGEVQLFGGLTAPVSRTYAAGVRDAGWF